MGNGKPWERRCLSRLKKAGLVVTLRAFERREGFDGNVLEKLWEEEADGMD